MIATYDLGVHWESVPFKFLIDTLVGWFQIFSIVYPLGKWSNFTIWNKWAGSTTNQIQYWVTDKGLHWGSVGTSCSSRITAVWGVKKSWKQILLLKVFQHVFDTQVDVQKCSICIWLTWNRISIHFCLARIFQAFLLLRGARSKTGKLRQWERPVREILND